jgi:electron transport complex protein RnfD
MSKLIVSLSPHAHGPESVEKNMYGVILALLPTLLVSFLFFGVGSVLVCGGSLLALRY